MFLISLKEDWACFLRLADRGDVFAKIALQIWLKASIGVREHGILEHKTLQAILKYSRPAHRCPKRAIEFKVANLLGILFRNSSGGLQSASYGFVTKMSDVAGNMIE